MFEWTTTNKDVPPDSSLLRIAPFHPSPWSARSGAVLSVTVATVTLLE